MKKFIQKFIEQIKSGELIKSRKAMVPVFVFVLLFAIIGVHLMLASHADSLANTNIAIHGGGGDLTYSGIGAVLGGGGNARYLMDYPSTQRSQILDYLFKPDYGASLQMLKLEIGGDANSTDGSEASIEHVKGQINCSAGYEFTIAQQALARNPSIQIYGLQWAAPGWVDDGTNSIFTNDDITYLTDWLNCAKQEGITVNYLGGWNESDDGTHAAWFTSLRTALDNSGYSAVQIVAGDTPQTWQYTSTPAVDILGVHDNCGYPTGTAGGQTTCSVTSAATNSGKPLWSSELGGDDAGAQTGCTTPCAPAMDRALVRGYIDARTTGYLEWPAIDAMPPGLNYENRGLVTADQPWSGNYNVNAMTWATAQLTQFVQPGWIYVDSGSGFLQNNRGDGSYVTLVNSSHNQWTTVVETTAGVSAAQQATFTVSGGSGNLSAKTVHVWASNFNFGTGGPSSWFIQQPDITPVNGSFTVTIQPGYVYTFTTTTGQTKGSVASIPTATPLGLPYSDTLATSGNAGSLDDEPQLLAAMYGSYELVPCFVADGSNTTCTQQTAAPTPLLWHGAASTGYFPYAIVGDSSWTNYSASSDVLFTKSGSSAGVIGRVSGILESNTKSSFNGYIFDVNDSGAWKLQLAKVNTAPTNLATGSVAALGVGAWHNLSLSMSGSTISASIDGTQVASATDATYSSGVAGIESGATSLNWPNVQYSNLNISSITTKVKTK